MANEKQMDSELIEELQQRLEALNNEGVMDAGVIDGFLTAYALNPEHPSKHDIYPYIFSEEGDPAALPEDDRILELLDIRLNEIQAALAAKGGLDPVIFPLVDDNDEINSLATPIIRNISPDDFETPEEAEQFVQEYRSGEMPKNLEDALYDLVKAVFDLKQLVDPNKPVVREEPRVGRNDPCPCGSSKKFKQCCGKK